ncbi:MAG: hypothetical protein M5U28_48400 [Sandaracinaceae bacterium]|nr:hypothetical protein [Sandaracinaceae bacterium]
MTASVEKVSVSLTTEELEWARERAARENRSVSAVVSEAIRKVRRDEARLAVLAFLGDAARPSADEAAEIRAEWEG